MSKQTTELLMLIVAALIANHLGAFGRLDLPTAPARNFSAQDVRATSRTPVVDGTVAAKHTGRLGCR